MNEPALASLVAGRRREGDHVVPDINPAAPDDHVATVSLAGPDVVTQWKTVYLDAPVAE